MFAPGDPQWTIVEATLPGAHLAIKEINNIPNLLRGYRLEILPVKVPKCIDLPYSGKLWQALNLANQSSECIGEF